MFGFSTYTFRAISMQIWFNLRLEVTQTKTGTPYQVISDNGNDMRKGVDLFCPKNKSVIAIYDLTSMMGIFIKHSLQEDLLLVHLQDDLYSLAQQ